MTMRILKNITIIVLFSIFVGLYGQDFYHDNFNTQLLAKWNKTEDQYIDIVVENQLAYIIYQNGLRILNIQKTNNIQEIGSSNFSLDLIYSSILKKENYLYIIGQAGLIIIDVVNSEKPRIIKSTPVEGKLTGIDLFKNFAIISICGQHRGFVILDITDPENVIILHRTFTKSDLWSVKVKGDYAYLGTSYFGIHVFDIKNPVDPVQIATINNGETCSDLDINQDLIYFVTGSGYHTFNIFNIKDPYHPDWIASMDVPVWCKNIHYNNNRIFTAGDLILIIDVNNPATPYIVGQSISYEGFVKAVFNINNNIYIVTNNWLEKNNKGLFILSFSSQNRFIKILSPNGGEIWDAWEKKTITWDSRNIPQINLSLSYNNGKSWNSIKSNLNGSLNQLEITVPNKQSYNCIMKITNRENSKNFDISDSCFTINRDTSLTLLCPNGGERWYADSYYRIQWESEKIDTMNLYFSEDNLNWIPIVKNVKNVNYYDWKVPSHFSEECYIRINSQDNMSIFDSNDSSFTIPSTISEWTVLRPLQGFLQSIWFTDPCTGYIARDDSIIYKTQDGGETWSFQKIGMQPLKIYFLDEIFGYLLGRYGQMMTTYDKGQTWNLIHLDTNVDLNDIVFLNQNSGIIVGNNGTIFKTVDSGETWQQKSSFTKKNLVSIENYDEQVCYITGESNIILKSSDGGENWKITHQPTYSFGYYYDIFPRTDEDIYITGYSYWNGYILDYSNQSGMDEYGLRPLLFNPTQNEWGEGVFYCLSFPTDSLGFVCGYNGTIFKTNNNGINPEDWIQQEKYTTKTIRSIHFVNDTTGYLSGHAGLIMKYNPKYRQSIKCIELSNNDIYTIQNPYPNPTSKLIHIKFSLFQDLNVEIHILNVLGRKVIKPIKRLKYIGDHKFEWNMDDFPSGLYLMIIHIGYSLEIKKFMLIK